MSTESDTVLDAPSNPGCGCPACMSGETTEYAKITASDLDSGATGAYGNSSALLTGLEWGPGGGTSASVTFSFLTSVPGYYSADATERNNFKEFSTEQKVIAREALELVETFANITFSEVSDVGDITWGQATLDDGVGAWAYYPDQGQHGGDIWTNRTYVDETNIGEGTYEYYVMMHELGHALGLQHTFSGGLDGAENTEQFSVMAYDNSAWGSRYAESFMLYDIAALQQIYGANTSYNSGNTTYVLENSAAKTLWDGGGTDTLDGSHLTNNVTIDLREASFSSIGNTNNFAIAYNTIIENYEGGSGDDIVYTNSSNNVVNGNSGSDYFYASVGSDTIDGGAGSDSVSYNYDLSDFFVSLVNSVTLTLEHLTESFTDTLSNIENYIFNGQSYTHSEIEDLTVLPEIAFRVDHSNGTFRYGSDTLENRTFTADQANIEGLTGNLFTVDRTQSDYTLTLEQDFSANNFSLGSGDEAETIIVSGTNHTQDIKIYAGAGGDTVTLSGISGQARVYGMDGDDTIQTGAGNDIIYGDLVSGGENWSGNDTLYGGGGNDYIYGQGGDDTLYGEEGDDRLYGGSGQDTLTGGNGNDILKSDDGNDTIYGDAGADRLFGGNGDDILHGDAGRDILFGGHGSDTASYANDGAGILAIMDVMRVRDGSGSTDRLDSIENIIGSAFADEINGNSSNNILSGGDGDDIIRGNGGLDTLNGGAGNDSIEGGGQGDTINGGEGDDKIFGLASSDTLNGGAGNDIISGGAGDDTIIGGAGSDRLWGDLGADSFGFTDISGGRDYIFDFSMSEGDALNITDIISGFDAATSDINDFVQLAFGSTTKSDLFVNQDGQGTDFEVIATFKTNFSGVSVDDLYNGNHIIVDQTLLV